MLDFTVLIRWNQASFPKNRPQTRIWVQVVYLRDSSRMEDEGMGKWERKRKKSSQGTLWACYHHGQLGLSCTGDIWMMTLNNPQSPLTAGLMQLSSVSNSCLSMIEGTSHSINFWTLLACSLPELCRLTGWGTDTYKWGPGDRDVGAHRQCLLHCVCRHKDSVSFQFGNHFFSQRCHPKKIVLAKGLGLGPLTIEYSFPWLFPHFRHERWRRLDSPQPHMRCYLTPMES